MGGTDVGADVGAGRCVAGGRMRVLAIPDVGATRTVACDVRDAKAVRELVGVAVCVSVSVVVAVSVAVSVGVAVAVPVASSTANGSGVLVWTAGPSMLAFALCESPRVTANMNARVSSANAPNIAMPRRRVKRICGFSISG